MTGAAWTTGWARWWGAGWATAWWAIGWVTAWWATGWATAWWATGWAMAWTAWWAGTTWLCPLWATVARPAWARWELVEVRAPPLLTDWWEVTAGAALARPSRAKHTKAFIFVLLVS